WQLRTGRLNVSPVLRVRRAFEYPLPEQFNLLSLKRLARSSRRHASFRIGRRDAPDEFALVGRSRHDRDVTGFRWFQRFAFAIKPDIRLSSTIVRAMA